MDNDELFPFKAEAVIIANGAFPQKEVMFRWLAGRPFTACCDGAANLFSTLGYPIDIIVGDGDSLTPELKEKYADRMIQIPEQETNDLTKTIQYLVREKGFRKIVILGATGLREDHTLGNISLLTDYLHHGVQALMSTDYGLFVPCKDEICLPTFKGQEVSIFRVDAVGLKGENLKYPLRDFDRLWQGTLNEATSTSIHIHGQGYFLVYLAQTKD